MDGNPKRINKDAFSKRSGYVWTGPKDNGFAKRRLAFQWSGSRVTLRLPIHIGTVLEIVMLRGHKRKQR